MLQEVLRVELSSVDVISSLVDVDESMQLVALELKNGYLHGGAVA
jgi:hypothetical protein